jgi:hypothetical protein
MEIEPASETWEARGEDKHAYVASGRLNVCTRRAIRSSESNWPYQLSVAAASVGDSPFIWVRVQSDALGTTWEQNTLF